MAFEPTLPLLIRTSSGVLWAALGLALLLRRGQGGAPRWLGAFLVLMAPELIGTNVAGMVQPPSAELTSLARTLSTVGNSLAAASLVMLLRAERRPGRPNAARAAGVGLAAAICAAGALQLASGGFELAPRLRTLSQFAVAAMIGAVAWHAAQRATADMMPRAHYLAALAFYPIAVAMEQILFIDAGLGALLAALLVATPALLAAVALVGRRLVLGSSATALGIAIIAVGALALTVRTASDGEFDVRGVARLVAFAGVTYAALSLGWLGRASARSRAGFAAAIMLPALFIVAQVAQNFLSAQYGLIMGGLVAGALLVAAKPIERALEGRHAPRAPGADAAKEEAYRKALRFALRDGRVTREEEIHLHEIAEELGIPGRRAHELLVEVERGRREGP